MGKSKKTKPYAQKLIPWIIFAVVIYAIADVFLQCLYGVEISSTLTTCWFAFWGVEIINLAFIKFGKVKRVRDGSEFGNLVEEAKETDEPKVREWRDDL